MNFVVRSLFVLAVVVLGIVSMWTTYVSLHDSILPEPTLNIPLADGVVWKCSVMALGMAVAIGIMLFALKVAVIQGHKRLNLLGVIGMTIVAFISIAFNLDVLYRTADRDFFLRYSNDRMRSVYEEYLSEVTKSLGEKRLKSMRQIARQEGELDAEVKGLRKAPAGYGDIARSEDYKLTLLQKTAQVELEAVDAAIKKKEEADLLLNNASIETIDDIQKLQEQLRVVCKDLSGPSEIRLPEVVRLENPLFAVFAKLFDWRTVGFKELFLLVIAFLMDLGDIIGYTLVPNRKRRPQEDDYSEALFPPLRTLHSLPEPEPVDPPALLEMPLARKEELRPEEPATGAASNYGATPHQFRSQRFRIRQR